MAQISIVKLKDIKQAKRFDAEYFKPEYLKDDKIITSHNWDLLKNLNIFNSRYRQPVYNEISEIKIINSQYIREDHINYESARTGFNNLVPFEAVLINSTWVWTLGRTNINYLKDLKISVDSHVNVIITNEKINPYYLTVFLQSKFWKNQIERNISWSSWQIEIYPRDFDKFLIPLLPQSFQLQIEKIVKEAYKKQSLSKQLYKEAEQLLLEELGLLNYKPKHTLTFTTTKKEIDQAQRFDAEYFQPKYKEIIKKIEEYEWWFDELENIWKFKNWSFISDKYYSTKGKRFYIRIKELSLNSSFNKDEMIRISDNFIRTNETVVEENDFVFATIWNTIWKVNLITKEFSWSFPSNNTSRFRLKKIVYPYFYELLFRSFVIQEQIQRYFTQTAQPKISNNQLEKIKIPFISTEIQKQISQKIQQSYKLRKESKELLEQAKKMVEEEIEKW